MSEEIVSSSCKVKFKTKKGGSLEFAATNNEFNKHLGKHSPLISTIKHLSFVCAVTSKEVAEEAIKAFNDGIEESKKKLAVQEL